MRKTFLILCVSALFAACGNGENQSDPHMYDSTANATSHDPTNRDSVVAAMADSAKDSAKKKPADTMKNTSMSGGIPKGTMDSGMLNAGAPKHLRHKKK